MDSDDGGDDDDDDDDYDDNKKTKSATTKITPKTKKETTIITIKKKKAKRKNIQFGIFATECKHKSFIGLPSIGFSLNQFLGRFYLVVAFFMVMLYGSVCCPLAIQFI